MIDRVLGLTRRKYRGKIRYSDGTVYTEEEIAAMDSAPAEARVWVHQAKRLFDGELILHKRIIPPDFHALLARLK